MQTPLESRSRCNNIHIVGVPEENILSTTDVSMLLMEAFQLGKETPNMFPRYGCEAALLRGLY